jgi:hypothetical protein
MRQGRPEGGASRRSLSTLGSAAALVVATLGLPAAASASEDELLRRIADLTQQLEALKAQVLANQEAQRKATEQVRERVQRSEERSHERWLTLGGDYQFRIDSLTGRSLPHSTLAADGTVVSVPALRPRNDLLMSNRLGLEFTARATENFSLSARVLMFKAFGSDDAASTSGRFFADRVGVFDGTLGHVPSSGFLAVDRVTATWTNLFDQDMWLSVGRRPSTDGAPTHLRQNLRHPGTAGTPALMVDYAFDGITVGWAPEWDDLPGAHVKVCFGRGFESGFTAADLPTLRDTDTLGISVVPIDTDPLRAWLRWNRVSDLFDMPRMQTAAFGSVQPRVNLGDVDALGAGVQVLRKRFGPGDLHAFAELAGSRTSPQRLNADGLGLLVGQLGAPEPLQARSGHAVYLGLRYDLPSRTKVGYEFNRGSRYWISFVPAAANPWTSKLGVRGQVHELYLIHDIQNRPLASAFAKTFFRLGVQFYDLDHTGSNDWLGTPLPLSAVAPGTLLRLAPVSRAVNAYATLEVKF